MPVAICKVLFSLIWGIFRNELNKMQCEHKVLGSYLHVRWWNIAHCYPSVVSQRHAWVRGVDGL